MSDRELIQAAARAAGYAVHALRQAERDRDYPEQIGLWIPDESTCWNPLIDSGHALRLAVKLNLAIFPDDYPKAEKPYVLVEASDPGQRPTHASEFHGADQFAATRRAITRAAAALSPDNRPAGGTKP